MNIILLEEKQFTHRDTALLSDRQTMHIVNVLKAQCGDTLNAGKVGGNMGVGKLRRQGDQHLLTQLDFSIAPPPSLNLELILALPRPQMLKRIIQTVATFGIHKLILIQTDRVEKSFWQSPSATDAAIRDHLLLGLEQGKATQLPEVVKYAKFHTFIHAYAASSSVTALKFIAHPGNYPMSPTGMPHQAVHVAIGPEGGFTSHEVDIFTEHGFTPIQLGPRILRVETAVTALLSRFY